MGEQPIFTTKAHVFHIDPATKKNWIPSSTGSVNVSFYYDSNRSTYRIISVDGSKAIINSTLVPNMSFTKTSQKFGQWSDARANTVYGLGFSSEFELNKFADKFGEVRDLTKQQIAPPVSQNSMPKQNGENSVDMRLVGPVPIGPVQNSEYMTPVLDKRQGAGSNGSDVSNQLKYENDRLKIALAQSSQNAKKWEVELQTLKNNNARLTAALQESTTNVEEWKKQLAAYKDENAKLKKMLIEHEQEQPNHQQEINKMQQEVTNLMDRLSVTETEKRNSENELEQMRYQVNKVSKLEDSLKIQEKQVQELKKEKSDVEARLNSVMAELDATKAAKSMEKAELIQIHDTFGRNCSELMTAQKQLAKLLNS